MTVDELMTVDEFLKVFKKCPLCRKKIKFRPPEEFVMSCEECLSFRGYYDYAIKKNNRKINIVSMDVDNIEYEYDLGNKELSVFKLNEMDNSKYSTDPSAHTYIHNFSLEDFLKLFAKPNPKKIKKYLLLV